MRTTPLLLVVAALSGCAVLPAAEIPPGPPAPADWTAPRVAGAAAPAVDWWTAFDDPALPALVAAAEVAAPSLSAARARLAAAAAARTAAVALRVPGVDATASARRGRDESGGAIANVYGAGLQARWELDLFGARRAAAQAAEGRLQATRAELAATRTALVAETVGSLVALRACEAQARQADLDAASRAETARLTETTARAGLRAPADAALARASAAQGRSQSLQQRAACEQLIKALVALTALDETGLRQRLAAATARVPQPAAIAPAGLPAALLQQRPDLVAAAQRVVSAAADRREAEAALWPQLMLTGSVGRARVEVAGFSVAGNIFSLGPLQMTVPLFDAGTRRAAAEATRAAYDDAVQQLAAALREAVREVEQALVALDATAARRADAEAAARDFEAVLRATEARQRGGLASLFELEDARRNAVAAQSALIELDRERATAWVSLARALGGGWTPNP